MTNPREIDAEVAEKVMGWKRGGKGDHTRPEHRPSKDYPGRIINDYENKGEHDYLVSPDGGEARFCGCDSTAEIPYYSTKITAAWEVVEKLNKDGFYFDIDNQYQYHADGEWEACFAYLSDEGDFTARADTAPMAICLAALKAVGVKP